MSAIPEIQLHPKYTEGEKLGAEITELCAYIYAATYRLLVLIREFDEKGYWELPGLVSCAHWLNFQCGIGIHAAREKVRVARALSELPEISQAFEKGEISYSKVRAMTRIATPENEDYLLMIARHGTAHHVERLVSLSRKAKRLQEDESANQQHDKRNLKFYYDDDGSLVIKARLPAEQGAMVLKAIELAMDKNDVIAGARPEGRPEAYGDIDVTAETRAPFPVRRAGALVEVAETYLDAEPKPASTADRYQVVVHVSAETLRDDVTAETSSHINAELSHIEDGPHIPAETSRRLACDCSVVRLIEDEQGEPLSIGRRSRSIPPSIRRALRARDDGCRFPGCDRTRYIDGHHIRHWADGGETSLDNLIQLCRHHHRLVHEGGFGCQRLGDGQIEFRSPRGDVLPGCVIPEIPPEAHDPIRWFESHLADVDIHSETCVTHWDGEPMDWDMAVGALFQRGL